MEKALGLWVFASTNAEQRGPFCWKPSTSQTTPTFVFLTFFLFGRTNEMFGLFAHLCLFMLGFKGR